MIIYNLFCYDDSNKYYLSFLEKLKENKYVKYFDKDEIVDYNIKK